MEMSIVVATVAENEVWELMGMMGNLMMVVVVVFKVTNKDDDCGEDCHSVVYERRISNH